MAFSELEKFLGDFRFQNSGRGNAKGGIEFSGGGNQGGNYATELFAHHWDL